MTLAQLQRHLVDLVPGDVDVIARPDHLVLEGPRHRVIAHASVRVPTLAGGERQAGWCLTWDKGRSGVWGDAVDTLAAGLAVALG